MVRHLNARKRASAGASSMRNRLRRAHNTLKARMIFKARMARAR